MPRRSARPRPDRTVELTDRTRGPAPPAAGPLWAANKPQRTVATLDGLVRLRLQVRSCRNPDCPRHGVCLRPEQEGRFALPQHEFGLDVIALVGALRHAEHRSVPEIHAELVRRGVPICARSVGNLLDRYDELLALSLLRRRPAAADHGGGRAGDPGHRRPPARRRPRGPLGPPRRASPARSCWPGACCPRLRTTWRSCSARCKAALGGADRRGGLRRPGLDPQGGRRRPSTGVPHQLCHFHYLREAAKPVYEADRHAKVQLKKKVRGIRPIERKVEGRDDAEAEAIRGYCAAVRSALTDDGRPPLEASGLKLVDRLDAGRREPGPGRRKKGAPEGADAAAGDPGEGPGGDRGAVAGRSATAFGWVRRSPRRPGATRRGWTPPGCGAATGGLLGAMARHRRASGRLAEAFAHFRKVTRSYWPGLFRCYDVADLPRTNNDLEQFFGSYRYHERRCQRPEGGLPGDGGARARCGWSPPRRRGCGRSRWPTWSRPTWRPGGPRVARWSGGRRCGRWAAASAAIPWPTSDRLRNR